MPTGEKSSKVAETARFELAERRTFGPLARAWFQPLTHVSAETESMAEVEGFEPPEGANPQQFSKLPPSTTRTHFLKLFSSENINFILQEINQINSLGLVTRN